MSRPTTVKIGAHHYSVTYHDLIYDKDEQQEYLGRCSYPDLAMTIKEGRAPSQLAETFLHEAVHAISNDRKLNLTEQEVDQIAAGVLGMMVDNPDTFGGTFLALWGNEEVKE
jgi:hypothetical protein